MTDIDRKRFVEKYGMNILGLIEHRTKLKKCQADACLLRQRDVGPEFNAEDRSLLALGTDPYECCPEDFGMGIEDPFARNCKQCRR